MAAAAPHPDAQRPKIEACDIDNPPESHDVGVKVFFRENELRQQVRAAGGRWSKSDKLWQMPYETAVSLGLEYRIAKR